LQQFELLKEIAMKKLILLVALALALVAGTTVITVYPQSAMADGCGSPNC
jgi:hypothetical protein